MKTRNLIMSYMLALVMALGLAFGLGAAFGDKGAQSVAVASADTHVNLQYADVDEFDLPRIGALPDTEVHPVHFCYEVTEVIWMYKTGNYFSEWNVKKRFEQGTTYRVGIVLTANDGYYYDSKSTHNAAINGEAVDYRVVDEKAIVLTKDFTMDSYITSVSVAGLKAPYIGREPDTEVICASDAYTANVVWYRPILGRTMKEGETFRANTSYRAEIHITANDGYVFSVIDKATGFVNGEECESTYLATNKEFIMYQYYDLGFAPMQDVKVKLDKPMPGSTPDFVAETVGDGFVKDYNENGYIHGVRWIDRYAGLILKEDDTFLADREYMLTVMIEADEDHEYTSARKYVYFNDKMCLEQPSTDPRVRVFEIYVRTPKEIASVNVTNLLKPVEGNTPDYWLDVDAEGVTIQSVEWEIYNDRDGSVSSMGENETFVDGKTYRMNVYMKNNNADKVFATKLNAKGERGIASSVTLNGEKIYPEVWTNEEGERDAYNYMWFYCWYTCESETVTQAVAWIEAPIARKTPSYNVSIAGDELTVESVYWTKYTWNDSINDYALEKITSDTAFDRGVTYCAFITVKVKGNRKIPYNPETNGCGMSGMVNGKKVDVYAVKKLDDGTEADPYKYAKLACWFKCNGEIIDTVDVSGIVAPVAGENPCYDRTILGTGYNAVGTGKDWNGKQDVYRMRNGVAWYDVTDGGMDYVYENQYFIGGHTYEVWIYLQTTDSNTFAVDKYYATTVEGFLNGYEAIVAPTVGSQQNYLLMRYAFTCDKMAVDEINVEIAEPVIGGKPDWTKIDSKYFSTNSGMDGEDTGMLNGIAWTIYGHDYVFTPNGDYKFEENTEYEVYIYITLKEGYIIEDADTFEVYLNGLRISTAMVFSTEPAYILIFYIFPKTECDCSIVSVAEVPATCTLNGMKAHYVCENCGTMYKDANGKELLDDGDEEYILWATGHNFGNWTPHEEYNNRHVGVCENCGETEEADCEFTAVFVKGPSKYSKYNGTLFACELCGNEGAFYVDESSCEHILGEWQETGRTGGKHYRTCECHKVYEEADCDYAITIVKAPSEYSDMRDVYLYSCKKCGSKYFEPIEGETITEESLTDETTNVTVSTLKNSGVILPQGTTVTAEPVNTDNISDGAKEMMEKSLKGKVDVIGGYDITLYYKGAGIQPNAAVTVTIPLGEDVEESDDLTVLYFDDYSVTEMQSVVFDRTKRTVTFETDHFSKYLIAKVTKNSDEPVSHEHVLGDWIVDKEATETEEGHRYKKCLICGDVLVEEVIPKKQAQKTGGGCGGALQDSVLALFAIVISASCLALRKRKTAR